MNCERLPRVMVLCFEPRVGHSIWTDYHYRNRTMLGLLRHLKDEVKSGRFVAYRLLTIHKEVMGVEE